MMLLRRAFLVPRRYFLSSVPLPFKNFSIYPLKLSRRKVFLHISYTRSSSCSPMHADSWTTSDSCLSTQIKRRSFSSQNEITRKNSIPSGQTVLNQLVFQIRVDRRKYRRINRNDIRRAVDILEKDIQLVNSELCTFLLTCCGSSLPDVARIERLTLTDRIWVLRKDKTKSVEEFETFLEVNAYNDNVSVDPLGILQEMKDRQLQLTEAPFYYALRILCQQGDLVGSAEILNQMKSLSIPISEKFFNSLILGNSRAGDIVGAEEIVEIMKTSQIDPSAATYATLMQTFIERNETVKLEKLCNQISLQVLWDDESLRSLVKVAGQVSNKEALDLVLRLVYNTDYNHVDMINVVKELVFSGHVLQAYQIVKTLPDAFKSEGGSVGNTFIRDVIFCSEENNSRTVCKICDYFITENLNIHAYNIATEFAMRRKKFELAASLLIGMKNSSMGLRPHYFWPMLVQAFDERRLAGLTQITDLMASLDVKLDWDTCYDWLLPRLFQVEKSPLEVTNMLQTLSRSSYSSGVLSAVVASLLKQGRVKDTAELVKKVRGAVKRPHVIVSNLGRAILEVEERDKIRENLVSSSIPILKYLKENVLPDDRNDYIGQFIVTIKQSVAGADPSLWKQFLNAVCKSQLVVSEGAFESIYDSGVSKGIDKLSVDSDLLHTSGNVSRGQSLLNPENMDAQALECHVKELTSKSMNTRGALRKLFVKHCQSGDLKKALDVKSRFETEVGTLTKGMEGSLLNLYLKHGSLKLAKQLYEQLRSQEEVDIDLYKILDLASLMLENDPSSLKEATAIVENDVCIVAPPLDPRSISRNVVRLLESISKAELQATGSDYGKPPQVKVITELLLQRTIAEATAPVLGIVIKHHLKRNDINEAVEEFANSCKMYKITPARSELMYAVLDLPDILEKVYSLSVGVWGEIDSKHDLAFVKADIGDIEGATKLFLDLDQDIKFTKILRTCEFLNNRKEVNKIINLASALKSTGKRYNLSKVYEIALRSSKRAGNEVQVMKIINLMQEEDIFVPLEVLKRDQRE